MTDRPTRRALLSVADKTGLVPFARALAGQGIELVSTGGTARELREAGLEVIDVAALTGAPGILDGRVKTLHPAIHGGILARRDVEGHMATIAALNIAPIDLVTVNLYPFEATVGEGAGDDEAIEMIDIGGPALLRAAAKNHMSVAVVCDPADYDRVAAALASGAGTVDEALRRELAAKAFARTAAYDGAIACWLAGRQSEPLPERLLLGASRREVMRYGENPQQRAALYLVDGARDGIAQAVQLQGKALSYNNLADADAAFELVSELAAPAVAIVKHANPCGVAEGDALAAAYARALACDPQSAYGGIVAVNRPLDLATAEQIANLFTEVVVAPAADERARTVLAAKQNLRLLLTGGLRAPDAAELTLRSISGGLLVQERDRGRVAATALEVVTERAPTPAELADLQFAFTVCKHVRSNAIVFARHGATVAIGAGQMSRVDAVRIAVEKAALVGKEAGEPQSRIVGSVVASDAFFPFPDGLDAALRAGATAAIQPGGSVRDAEVIAAADRAGAAMVFTGIRHFRH
jgi:phosphoribosylaminoimidazolecarboxamide formyltransferase / IMP cyclohydrolase